MKLKKIFVLFSIGILLISCKKETTSKEANKILQNNTAKTNSNNSKVFKDTLEFLDYNDQGDYFYIYFKENKDTLIFINDNNKDRSLLRGDIVEVKWKEDVVYVAGDGETKEEADWIISSRKIQDGSISKFRKNYKKEFKYNWFQDEYSQDYLDHLYKLVEYYVANSKNELLRLEVKGNNQLEYSIEEQEREGMRYTIMGLGISFEGRTSKIQWLYYNRTNQKLYEYDLGNDKLILFE